jgi:hypothetical protein
MQNETQMLSEAKAAKRSEASATPLHLPTPAEDSGYRVADVRAAAAQAGISAEFVTLALAESEGIDAHGFRGAAGERVATRLLGTSQRSSPHRRPLLGLTQRHRGTEMKSSLCLCVSV